MGTMSTAFYERFAAMLSAKFDSVTEHINYLHGMSGKWHPKSNGTKSAIYEYHEARKAIGDAGQFANNIVATIAYEHPGDAACFRDNSNLARFIRALGFPLQKNDDLYFVEPERFEDAVVASAQYAFDKLIIAKAVEAMIPNTTRSLAFAVEHFFKDGKQTYHHAATMRDFLKIIDNVMFLSERDTFSKAEFHVQSYEGDWEDIGFALKGSDKSFDDKPTDVILNAADMQLRANLYRKAYLREC